MGKTAIPADERACWYVNMWQFYKRGTQKSTQCSAFLFKRIFLSRQHRLTLKTDDYKMSCCVLDSKQCGVRSRKYQWSCSLCPQLSWLKFLTCQIPPWFPIWLHNHVRALCNSVCVFFSKGQPNKAATYMTCQRRWRERTFTFPETPPTCS